MPKYTIQDAPYKKILHHLNQDIPADNGREVHLFKDNVLVATFHGDGFNNRTNAQKVCDLLNEGTCCVS